MAQDRREIRRKLQILRYAKEIGHIAKTYRYFRSADPAFIAGGKLMLSGPFTQIGGQVRPRHR